MKKRHLAVAAFMLWEAYWAYVYMSATIPDEKMDTVFALLMGVILPLLLLGPAGLVYELRKGRTHKPAEKPE